MASIDRIISTLEQIESPQLLVHSERCVAVRNRHARCRRCAEACTSGAISIEDGHLSMRQDLCIGCGTCATVCPTAALEARDPSDSELLQEAALVMQDSPQQVVFACEPLLKGSADAYDKGRVIHLRCLGRVEESALVALAAGGVTDIRLCAADCATCPNRTGLATIQKVQASFHAIMDTWGQTDPLHFQTGLVDTVLVEHAAAKQSSQPDGVSRRGFFTALKEGATKAAADVLTAEAAPEDGSGLAGGAPQINKVMADGTLPHFIPNRRERMLDQLDTLGTPQAETIETRLWGHLRIDEELCNSCRMCATFCSTGAIVKYDDADGSFGIEHYPADCVQCLLCQDICPTKALTIDSAVPVKELTEGTIERHPMKPLEREYNTADSIWKTMRHLIGEGHQVYDS
jgi:Fe-S-cluster-containing hydrogenase component 2